MGKAGFRSFEMHISARPSIGVNDLSLRVEGRLLAGPCPTAIVITRLSTVTQQLWQLFQSGQEVIRANGTIALRTWGVFSGTHQ